MTRRDRSFRNAPAPWRWMASLALVGVLAAPGTAEARTRNAAMGAEGEVFSVSAGAYGDLFEGVGLAAPENPALALDVTYPDESRERLLVPGTEASELEKSPSVLFEDESGTLFLLWQTDKNGIHSWLNLVGYRDGEWSEAIEISGSPFGWKSSPQLAVTRDTFETREEGEARLWSRTVVHLIWWEYGEIGPRVLYSPVIFLNGEYAGWNPVYHLDELELATGERPLAGVGLDIARSPRIRAGRNGQSVTIGFVVAESGELVTVVLELLPGEIGFLAGDVRAQIVDLGRDLPADTPRGEIAGKVRAQIVDLGRKLGLHPGLSAYLAEQVSATVRDSNPNRPLQSLGDDVRAQIVDLGAHMTENGFDRAGSFEKLQVLEVTGDPAREASAAAPPNLIRLVRASARLAPQTAEDENALFLSRDGKDAIVAWSNGSFVFYRETTADEWSNVYRLPLGGELDLDRAWEMLERRVE